MEKNEKDNVNRSIYELIAEELLASGIEPGEEKKRMSCLEELQQNMTNVLLAGATGSGKSSTINAMFGSNVAEAGVGAIPATSGIKGYAIGKLVLWDSPGFGDGPESDKEYAEMIREKLSETGEDGAPLIDLVLVVLDASSKDLGTSIELINSVIVPCLGKDNADRILIGLNQADMAMKGRHWDSEKNEPDEMLQDFLKEKARSVQNRIEESTGIYVRPIYYCAGYTDENGGRCKPYNLTKLFYYIVKSVPEEKRIAFADYVNTDNEVWLYDDGEEDYKEKVRVSFLDAIMSNIWWDAGVGGEMGAKVLGIPGRVAGTAFGASFGLVHGFIRGIFG